MQQNGVLPDKAALVTIFKVCSSPELISEGRMIHASLRGNELDNDTEVGNAAINMYGRSHCCDAARETFDSMPRRDSATWGSILTTFSQHDEHGKVMELFELGERRGEAPVHTKAGCLSVIRACGNLGALARGRKIHSQIEDAAAGSLKSCGIVGFGEMWVGRCGALWAPRRQLHKRADPVRAIAALERARIKVEVCNQVKVDKGAPPAQAAFLDLPDDVSEWWLTGRINRKLLVRECYDPIFNLVWQHNEVVAKEKGMPRAGAVLLGNPGIGKTGFLWLALWKLLAMKRNIIIRLPTIRDYICVSWTDDDQLKVEEHRDISDALWARGNQPWYLADNSIPSSDWALRCKFLLTCSPVKADYYEFAKAGSVRKFFDPVWTENELLALNEHNFGHDPEEVSERFLKWGGVPYYVLEKIGPDVQMEIRSAIGAVRDFDQIIKLQSLQEDQSHKVLHMIVDESTYSAYRLALASPYVEQQLLSNLPLPDLKRFLSVEQPDALRDVQGKLLEHFICEVIIPKGSKLQYRELQENGEFGPVLQGGFPKVASRYDLDRKAGAGREAVFPAQILPGHKNALFKPSSARNAEWDFIVNGSLYQVTVTEERALRLGQAFERALEFLRVHHGNDKELDFCILVPLFNLTKFTVNWFDTVKLAEKGKKWSFNDRQEIVGQVMRKLEHLNVKVKMVSLDIGDDCPGCMRTGFISSQKSCLPCLH
ncbi:hypothetical protein SELMODRAFT_446907 [Selaginella moellendorffii]|uniref:Uncharacterized protein n=1 Tax=Selaginella moellendorffii TaxID=88036 RepID=D8SVA6_SELML|nr:hypothetical protein SELMODRAFT_446907 [Selaginella moellendorffii]